MTCNYLAKDANFQQYFEQAEILLQSAIKLTELQRMEYAH
jgi:hypothetical protein